MSSTALSPPQSQRPLFHGRLLLPDGTHTLAIFIDSGADACIINEEVVLQLGLKRVLLPHPVPARALDGHILGTVMHQTSPVHLLLSLALPVCLSSWGIHGSIFTTLTSTGPLGPLWSGAPSVIKGACSMPQLHFTPPVPAPALHLTPLGCHLSTTISARSSVKPEPRLCLHTAPTTVP